MVYTYTMTLSTAAAPATQVTTWQIDSAHSLVEFAARHMMVATVKGRFTDLSGSLEFDPANLATAKVDVEIGAASINTLDAQRDAHLRSPDFLDVENFPRLRFVSTRVEPLGEDRARIYGELTIHGVTREVVLEAEFNGSGQTPYGKTVAGFTAHTSFNRKDFGLNWNVALETGGWLVSDTIKVNLEIEAVAA
jgi:polyisoprenoid-binding protein YceI